QRVLQHDLAIRGMEDGANVTWSPDQFGNRVANVVVPRVSQAVDFEAVFQVERDRTRSNGRRPAPWPAELGPLRYLRPTALTAPDSRLLDAAIGIVRSADDPRERADRAHDWASGSIRYQLGVTGYTTPAAMALHFQKGVCQDFAHILLAILRLANIPCRYVSGHLLGEGAPHAWVEALIADPSSPGEVEVIAYDPTHHRRARMDYITVATGRDFADVTLQARGITFAVNQDPSGLEKIMPFDLVPRIILPEEWDHIERGLEQRVRALNLFLHDIYHEQKVLGSGLIPPELVLGSRGYRREVRSVEPPLGVYTHVVGSDLVRDHRGEFYVLEDNLRVPSGVSYVVENRRVLKRVWPQIFTDYPIRPVEGYPQDLLGVLREIALPIADAPPA